MFNINPRGLHKIIYTLQKIIKRTVYPEVPPKVEYSFTELGETLEPVFQSLCDWGTQYLQALNSNTNI